MVSPSSTPNTSFLVDMSHEQLWLEAEAQSVSSLEADSESESESESRSGSSSSEEDEEEELDLPPPPTNQGRFSRKDRLKHQKLDHKRQLAPVSSSLRKTTLRGSSAPNLKSLGGFGFQKPTNLGGLCPAQNAPTAMPHPDQGLEPPMRKLKPGKKQTNANWKDATGASKAGLSLLNDVRIGMTTTDTNDTSSSGGGLNKMKKSMASQPLDVSLTGKCGTQNSPPQRQRQEEQEEATVNITTVSVSLSFAGSRTPSQRTVSSGASPKSSTGGSAYDLPRIRRAQPNGPVNISPKRSALSPKRASRHRRRTNSAGDIVNDASQKAMSESDPALWIVEHEDGGHVTANGISSNSNINNRWNSNSPMASGSNHTRESRKKKTLIPTSIKVISAMPEQPEPPSSGQVPNRMRRRHRSSAPTLLGMTLSMPTITADGTDPSPSANSRWSSNSRMKTSSSASAMMTADRDPAAERCAPAPTVASTRRNFSSHSAPGLSRWLASEQSNKGDDGDGGVAVDRWKAIVVPALSSPKSSMGVKAKSLSDILNTQGGAGLRQEEEDDMNTTSERSVGRRAQMMMDNQSGSAPSLTRRRGLSPMNGSGANSPSQRGIQRTSSRMVMSTSSNKLSAPNLQAMNTNNRGGGGSGALPPPPPLADYKNARWNSTGTVKQVRSFSNLRLNHSNALSSFTPTTKATSPLQPRRGLQHKSPSQTLRKQLDGLSTPNLASLGKRLGGGLSMKAEEPVQRGVQRASSRMVMSTSSSGLQGIGLSAPNLLRTTNAPASGPAQNAQWSSTGEPATKYLSTSNALDPALPALSLLQQRGMQRSPNTSQRDSHAVGVPMNVEEPVTQLKRGVQRSSSKMVMSTSSSSLRGLGLSAPNLLGISRLSTVPKSEMSMNAQWGKGPTGSTSGAGPIMKSSNLLQRRVQRASSRMVMSSSKLAGAGLSAPQLQNILQVNAMQQSGSKNDQWNSIGNGTGGLQAASALLQQAVKRTNSRSVAASTANRLREVGISAPNLASQWAAPARGTQNAQWVRKSSPRLGGPTMSMNPMAPLATPAPSSTLVASCRWDSSSTFDGLRSSGSGSNIVGTSTTDAGMKGSSLKNPKESIRNPSWQLSLKSSSRMGESAPNLMSMKRVCAALPLNGSSNAEWAPKARHGLEAMLDDNRLAQALATLPCGRWEESGSSGNLSGIDQLSTKKMLSARRHSKSGGRRRKKKHKDDSRDKKADTTPPIIRRTNSLDDTSAVELECDSKSSSDAPPTGNVRSYTEDSIESIKLAEGVGGLVKDVTDFVASELQVHTESENSVAQATASLAALEITRNARMALRKERSDRSLGGKLPACGGTHCLGCTETIPETGDESVDACIISEACDDFDDEDEQHPENGHYLHDEIAGRLSNGQVDEDIHHRVPFSHEDSDKQLKAPVRQSSGQSQKRCSITDVNLHHEPLASAPKPASNGPIKPVRRASVAREGLSAMMPGLHQSFGIDDPDDAGEMGSPKSSSLPGAAIHAPARRASTESTGDGSLGLPFSHVPRDGTSSDDVESQGTMPSICSSSARPYPASMISHKKGSSKTVPKKPPNMFGSITDDVFSMLAAGVRKDLLSREPNEEAPQSHDCGNVEANAEEESRNLEGPIEDPEEVVKVDTQPEIGEEIPAMEETDGILGEVKSEPLCSNGQCYGKNLAEEEAKAGKDCSRALPSRLPSGSTPHAGTAVLRDGAIA